MSNAQHTPEPWQVEEVPYFYTIKQKGLVSGIASIQAVSPSAEQARANAFRIAAAVNACQGIPTKSLERGIVRELIEALDYLLTETVDMDLKHGITLSEGEEHARDKAIIAIAKAAGQTKEAA